MALGAPLAGEDGLSVLQSDLGFIALWLVLHAIFDNLVAQRIFPRDGKGRWFCIHGTSGGHTSPLRLTGMALVLTRRCMLLQQRQGMHASQS